MLTTHVATVKEFTEQYSPVSFYKDWDTVISCMLEDPAEANIVDELILEYRRLGGFRNPVLVNNEDEDSFSLKVANGMHRTVAALLMGNETVLEYQIAPSEGTPEYQDWYNTMLEGKFYDLSFCVHDDVSFNNKNEFYDYVTDHLRSFKVTDDYWFDADLCSMITGYPIQVSFSYSGDIEEIKENLLKVVSDKIFNHSKFENYISEFSISESEDD